MIEPVGVTLGAVGLIAPAVQACWAAYGAYRELEAFGTDYRISLRRLRSQRERLELLMRLKLGEIVLKGETDWNSFCETVVGELVTIKDMFAECNRLIRLMEPQHVKSDTGQSHPQSEKTEGQAKSRGKGWTRRVFHRDRPTSTTSRSGSSSMLSPTTSITASTPGTSISSIEIAPPPSLATSRVEEAAAHEEMKVKNIQAAKSKWGKFWWATLHKEDFQEAIEIIKSSIDTLWNMIQVKAAIDPELLKGNAEGNDLEFNNVASLLERTHAAIRAINHRQEDAHVELGIGLVPNHKSTAERWAGQGISFVPNSYVIQIQAHLPKEESRSRLLLTEVYDFSDTSVADIKESQHGKVINSLRDSISSHEVAQDAEGNFQLIGHIAQDEPPKPIGRVFQDVSAIWTPKGSLSLSLQQAELRKKNLVADHVNLASLVVLPYFQCGNSQMAIRHPRAENYRFYDTVPEAGAVVVEGDAEPSLPYVFCGFGTDMPRPSTRSVGKSVPPDQSVNTSAIELGLLLFQIGSWSKLEYLNGKNSLETMKSSALESIDSVVAHSNIAFAKLVEMCLLLPTEGTGKRAYYEIMKRLQSLGDELRS